MGGEMIFYHRNKPIENLSAYERLLKDMRNDLKTTEIPIVTNPVTTWGERDEDYELSVDLGRSTRNPNNHYYILFPKDPNLFKVISDMHARGLPSVKEYDGKKWIHPWLIKFVTTFPGVFSLYYGDGYSGYSEVGEIVYHDGSACPTPRNLMSHDKWNSLYWP